MYELDLAGQPFQRVLSIKQCSGRPSRSYKYVCDFMSRALTALPDDVPRIEEQFWKTYSGRCRDRGRLFIDRA